MRVSGFDAVLLRGLARGNTYEALASGLHVSAATIAYHVSRLKSMTGASSAAALVCAAVVGGVLSADCWPVELTGTLEMLLPDSRNSGL